MVKLEKSYEIYMGNKMGLRNPKESLDRADVFLFYVVRFMIITSTKIISKL